MPVAEGVRDGDYRLTPDGPGDEPLPGKGDRFNYGVECCFLPQPGQPFEVPPVYFGANGMDVAEDQKSFVVEPGYLKVLAGSAAKVADAPGNGYLSSGRRRALAEWIASPDNPLTARVMVNRVWHWHFGRGIVPTPSNFGKMGMPPSHPELLDWLATEFVRQGWSIKQMHRLIMTSETYKMASSFSPAANLEKDPDQRLPVAIPVAPAGRQRRSATSSCRPAARSTSRPAGSRSSRRSRNRCEKATGRQVGADQGRAFDLAAQRLLLLEARAEVSDVRGPRSARPERDLRKAQYHDGSDAGADAVEQRVRVDSSAALRRTGRA